MFKIILMRMTHRDYIRKHLGNNRKEKKQLCENKYPEAKEIKTLNYFSVNFAITCLFKINLNYKL